MFLGDTPYHWFIPVEIEGSEHVVLDLDNQNVSPRSHFNCNENPFR